MRTFVFKLDFHPFESCSHSQETVLGHILVLVCHVSGLEQYFRHTEWWISSYLIFIFRIKGQVRIVFSLVQIQLKLRMKLTFPSESLEMKGVHPFKHYMAFNLKWGDFNRVKGATQHFILEDRRAPSRTSVGVPCSGRPFAVNRTLSPVCPIQHTSMDRFSFTHSLVRWRER